MLTELRVLQAEYARARVRVVCLPHLVLVVLLAVTADHIRSGCFGELVSRALSHDTTLAQGGLQAGSAVGRRGHRPTSS